MSSKYGKTRVAVDLRASPNVNAKVRRSLPVNTSIRVIHREGDWLYINTMFGRNLLISAFRDQRGYIPAASLALIADEEAPQPDASLSISAFLQELPAQLKVADLKTWLDNAGGDQPPWLSSEQWAQLPAGKKIDFKSRRKTILAHNAEAWSRWLAELEAQGRAGTALLREWLTILRGGQDMFPIRAHTIHPEPNKASGPPVWVNPDEVLRWSGHVQRDGVQTDWFAVQIYKWNRENTGWFRGELLEEYTAPTADNDPATPANATKVFDLSRPSLRAPQDNEIGSHPNAAQYIDIYPVIERHLTHRNLCGEFCAAALGNMDIFPFLAAWHAAYARADAILHNNQATFLIDVKAMIEVIGLRHRDLKFRATHPLTARRLQEGLVNGEKLIAGVGIKHTGEVHADGTIAHWVVVVDARPVGTSGWVRIYNPFHNREEAYPYAVFTAAQNRLRAGLWVAPDK